MRRNSPLIAILIVIALIVLPTGTPEDIPTTLAIIRVGGWKLYLLLAGIVILLLVIFRVPLPFIGR